MNGRTSNVERELKLHAPSTFSLARLPSRLQEYTASPARFARLHTVYYDSDDYCLMRWGCSLRFRRGEGWTLKIPVLGKNGNGLSRVEHEFDGDGTRVPANALALATPFLRGRPVRPVAELRTLRVKREFTLDGHEVAEVVEDDVRVVDGTAVERRFSQLEIELQDEAGADVLDAIAELLRGEGAGDLDPTPKNALAIGADVAPEIAIPHVDRRSPIGDVVRAALGEALVQYVHCDPLLRTSDDVEAVHKARVAMRKLRSHFHTFAPVLEEPWASDMRERLRWLQDALAPVRDADVFEIRMASLAQQLPHADVDRADGLLEFLRRHVREEHEALRQALREDHYADLLDDIVTAVREPRFRIDPSEPAGNHVCEIVARVFKKARKRVRKAGRQPSDRALHRIRIASKHLRYAAESFACVAGKRAARYAELVETLQETLGAQHDGVVALQRLRAFDGSGPERFAAGELAILASLDGVAACARWREQWNAFAAKRKRFWR